MANESERNGHSSAAGKPAAAATRPARPPSGAGPAGSKPTTRRGTVAKVSHTLSIALAERLEEFAFFQRLSESAVIEHALATFFAQNANDEQLGEQLRQSGAGRRRKSV